MFKREVETPYWINTTNHDEFSQFIGATTPREFPFFSECDQEIIDKKVSVQSKAKLAQSSQPSSAAVVYVRQYYWPLFLPEPFGNPYDNFIRHHEMNPQLSMAHTTPCVMRQIAIPVESYFGKAAISKISSNQPQVIETHSWVPWWMLRWYLRCKKN